MSKRISSLISLGFGLLIALGLAACLMLIGEFHQAVKNGQAINAGSFDLRASVRSLRGNYLEMGQVVSTRLLDPAPNASGASWAETARLDAQAHELTARAVATAHSAELAHLLRAVEAHNQQEKAPLEDEILALADSDPAAGNALYFSRYLPVQRESMRLVDQALKLAVLEIAGMSKRWAADAMRGHLWSGSAIALFLGLGISIAILLTRAVASLVRRAAEVAGANSNMMENSIDIICTVDAAGCFTKISAACEKTWGYRPEDRTGASG